MAIFSKSAGATLDYGFDWSDWLDSGESIDVSSWSVDSGITVEGSSFDETSTKVWISGGTAGEEYTVTNTIETTESGTTDIRSFTLVIDGTSKFRVTACEVKEIIDVADSLKIEPFIRSANLIVTQRLGNNSDLSAAQKKEIERWLAAHFIAVSKHRQAKMEQIGDDGAKMEYTGKFGKGLEATSYGQQVLVHDTSGTLANIGKVGVGFKAIPHTGS